MSMSIIMSVEVKNVLKVKHIYYVLLYIGQSFLS